MKAPSPRDAASRTALQHKVRDDAVELGALVVERLAALAHALLARAQGSKVLDRLRHDVAVEAHDDAAGRRAADRDVEEDLRALASISFASRASDGRGTAGRSRLSGHWISALLVTLGSAAARAAAVAATMYAKRAMMLACAEMPRACHKRVCGFGDFLVCHDTLAACCAATKKVFRSAWATARRRNI